MANLWDLFSCLSTVVRWLFTPHTTICPLSITCECAPSRNQSIRDCTPHKLCFSSLLLYNCSFGFRSSIWGLCHQSILKYFIFMLAILRMKHVQHIGLTKVLSQVGFSIAAIIYTMCPMKKALDMYAWLCGQWLQKVNERGKRDQTLICAVMVLVSNE